MGAGGSGKDKKKNQRAGSAKAVGSGDGKGGMAGITALRQPQIVSRMGLAAPAVLSVPLAEVVSFPLRQSL